MFSFFRKSKKEDNGNGKKNKDKNNKDTNKAPTAETPEEKQDYLVNNYTNTNMPKDLIKETNINEMIGQCSSNNSEMKMCKNNQPSTPELALDCDSIPLPKNVVNAAKTISSEAATFYEKNNEPNDAKMCDPYVKELKVPDASNVTQRRGSSVKPCGHGTTAISPWVPIQTAAKKDVRTPPGSPLMEVKRTVKFTVNGIQEKDEPQDKRIIKNEKESENLSIASKGSGSLEELAGQEKYV